VEQINIADYSRLLIKLHVKGIITDRHKRHLELIEVTVYAC